MEPTKLEYYQIAEIQIETAIDLYNAGNYIGAITLAGAGEEILGNLLPPETEKAMDTITSKLSELVPDISHQTIRDDHLNLIKNGFKHLKEKICDQDINIKLEACQYIARACTNYAALLHNLTSKMISFSEAHPE